MNDLSQYNHKILIAMCKSFGNPDEIYWSIVLILLHTSYDIAHDMNNILYRTGV